MFNQSNIWSRLAASLHVQLDGGPSNNCETHLEDMGSRVRSGVKESEKPQHQKSYGVIISNYLPLIIISH